MPFLEVQNVRLEYQLFGPESGSTIVLLHEGLGSLSRWRDFPQQLSEAMKLRVFAYSRGGYGNSDPVLLPRSAKFMHEEATILAMVLQKMEMQRPVLFGHSDGGSIAMIYAGNHPSIHPSALILEAPHVFVEDLTLQTIAAGREEYGTLKPKFAKHHRDPDHTFHGWTDIWLHPDFKSWNIEEYISRIAVPMLLIQGLDDEHGTLEQVSRIERHTTSRVQTVLLHNCRHSPHHDAPAVVIQSIRQFLSRSDQDPQEKSDQILNRYSIVRKK